MGVRDHRAIDAVCNLFTPEVVASRPDWTRTFHQKKNRLPGDITSGVDLPRHLSMMDAAGVERALLIAAKIGRRGLPGSWELDPRKVKDAIDSHPDRFLGLYGINPYDTMAGVKELEDLVVSHGFVGAHLYPHWFEMPPDHPRYYPFYTKCAELGVPIQIQIGYCRIYAPEQRLESVGRPITLDRVACHLPELKIVGIHVGWPWTEEMISVADKHPNVYIGVDRHAPSRWGTAMVEYLSSWGQDKVIFGTDFPVVPYDVAARELEELDLPDDILAKLLRTNAEDLYQLT